MADQPILIKLKSVFDQLQDFDLSDPNKVMIINTTNMTSHQINVIYAYANHTNRYSFACNCNLFPILDTVYRCAKCKKRFTGIDARNDYGTIGQGYYGSYFKCLCDIDNPSVLYLDHNDEGVNMDFQIIKNFNAILMTTIAVTKHAKQSFSIEKIVNGINSMTNFEFYYGTIDKVQISGSDQIETNVKNIMML